MALTEKQRAFVREYLYDFNATAAALRAGYAKRSARQQAARLLSKDDIQGELRAYQQAARENTNLTVQWVLDTLSENVERAMQATPVYRKEHGEWIETGEWEYQGAVANKALELIGKHLGMFADKQEHSGELTIRVVRE